MKTIVVCNQKGGVGKTTTAVTLAHGLALYGFKTLLIDLDPQGQCAVALGMEAEPGVFNWLVARRPAGEVLREGRPAGNGLMNDPLWLMPGDRQTAYIQLLWSAQNIGIDGIESELRGFRKMVDRVVIDTSPSVGGLQERALYAADLVIVPTATDFLSADAVAETMATMQANQNYGWKGRLLGVLPTFFDEVTKESISTLEDLKRSYGEQVLTPIHRATVLRECAAEGQTIWEKDWNCRAAAEYAELVRLAMGVGL